MNHSWKSSIINSNFGVTESMSSGLMWLAVHFCHFSFWLCFLANVDGTKKWKHDGLVTDQFFKKAETLLNATFLQNASNFIFIHLTFYLKMSIERFKASLESFPISMPLTYGWFHWPVFVLNTILAVSRVFRGSSFASRDQNLSPSLTVFIFRTNLLFALLENQVNLCLCDLSDLLQRLSFPPAEFAKGPSLIYLSVILHIFLLLYIYNAFLCDCI